MRLKKMVRLSEDELAAIYAALAVNVRGYHQVVEVRLSLYHSSNQRDG